MGALAFLLAALLAVAVVGAWLYYRDRRPTSLDEGIDGFRRELEALAPENFRPRGYNDRGGPGPSGPAQGPGGGRPG